MAPAAGARPPEGSVRIRVRGGGRSHCWHGCAGGAGALPARWLADLHARPDPLAPLHRLPAPLAWSAGKWSADMVVLTVALLAAGSSGSPIAIAVRYGVANLLNSLPLTPGRRRPGRGRHGGNADGLRHRPRHRDGHHHRLLAAAARRRAVRGPRPTPGLADAPGHAASTVDATRMRR